MASWMGGYESGAGDFVFHLAIGGMVVGSLRVISGRQTGADMAGLKYGGASLRDERSSLQLSDDHLVIAAR